MNLATRLELVAKETTSLQAELEQQGRLLQACQREKAGLERELEARCQQLSALETRLVELARQPRHAELQAEAPAPQPIVESIPLSDLAAPVQTSKAGGLLQRFKRNKKTDDVPAMTAELSSKPIPVEAVEAPEEEPEAVVQQESPPVETAPSGPAIVAKRFAPPEFLSRLPDLDDAQLDLLNFGVVQLDDDGAVVALNLREGACTGVSRADALDRTYFTQILATADGKKLQQKLTQGAKKGKLDLPLLTNLSEGEETVRAIVHLYRHAASKTNWSLVRRESDGK